MIYTKDNVIAHANNLHNGKKREKRTVNNLVKFSNGQMDIIRSEKIDQANVVGNECCDDT